jgi:hypothetical protein
MNEEKLHPLCSSSGIVATIESRVDAPISLGKGRG